MNEDDISKASKDSIPDAKYYLVRPKNSEMLFIMDKKPDYKEEPFYDSCKECKLDMNNYLEEHCLDRFDTDNMSSEEDSYLYVLGICPPDNSIGYVFGRPAETEVDVFKTLTSIDTYSADREVARYYEAFNWHILTLLNNEPFKSYIREHLDEFKAPSTPGPTKESKGIPIILNKRLLI